MNSETIIEILKKNRMIYEFSNVKIKGNVYYYNYSDDKWVCYAKDCVMKVGKHCLVFENIKFVFLGSKFDLFEHLEKDRYVNNI